MKHLKKPLLLGIIPARGGSKGIKDKNIIPFCGKPLIAHTILAAKASAALSDFIISTDSEKIAEVAKTYGAEVPFLRPSSLAEDNSPTLTVLQHAVKAYELEKNITVDAIMLLQPTAPLRTTQDIDSSWNIFLENSRSAPGETECLISCYDGNFAHPKIMYKRQNKEGRVTPFLETDSAGVRRQEFENVFIRNGAIYICSRALLLEKNKIFDNTPLLYLMPKDRSVNIDVPEDLVLADFYAREARGR